MANQEMNRADADVSKVTATGETMDMAYILCKPTRWTFENDKIREWMTPYLEGRVLNACAGKTKLNYDGEIIRNDLNTDRDADTHHDVCEIADHFAANSFDAIIYDPPFSTTQAKEKYSGISPADNAEAKREFDTLLRAGGRVIQFGYTTTCMPGELGYTRKAVAIFNTVGPNNDILGTVDERLNGSLSEF